MKLILSIYVHGVAMQIIRLALLTEELMPFDCLNIKKILLSHNDVSNGSNSIKLILSI